MAIATLSLVQSSGARPESAAEVADVVLPSLESELNFRRTFGYSTDAEYVARNRAERGDNAAAVSYGAVLSDAELEDFRARLARVPQIGDFLASLEHMPAYGGGYTDQAAGGDVVVAFVGDPPADLDGRAREFGLDVNLRVRSVTNTFVELQDAQHRLWEAIDALRAKGIRVTYTALDVFENEIEIGVDRADLDDDARRVIEAIVPARLGSIHGTDPRPSHDESAVYAGDGIDLPWGPCSAGFAVRNPFMVLTLTAGHCETNATAVHMDPFFHWHGLPFVSQYWFNGAHGDGQLHDPSGAAPGWVRTAGGVAPVHFLGSVSGWFDRPGDPICLSGRNNRNCGAVTHVPISTVDGSGFTIYNLRCASYVSAGGDSGGAVYGPNLDGSVTAVGIHKGIAYECPGGGGRIYSHLGFLMYFMGLTDVVYG